MAASFEMDPQAASSGLNAAGQTRTEAAGKVSGVQTPAGNYTAEFAGALRGLLTGAGAQLGSTAAEGLASTALSVTTVEATEAGSTNILTT